MKIVLLGKSGMLGSAFLKLLDSRVDIELHGFDFANLDVTKFDDVRRVITNLRPDFVINCSGYTNVDLAESEPEKAFTLNAHAVENLGKLSVEFDFKLIHFSTDYVFSGEKVDGYLENDKCGPLNVYGDSKLAGERALISCGANSFIVRTAWLFGPNGKNFVDTMVKIAKESGTVRVVGDQFGSPTYTFDLANAVIRSFIDQDKSFGVYHLTNLGEVSWCDFAKKIFNFAKLNVSVESISSAEFARPAKRPNHGILINSKLPLLRPYEESLREYIGLHFA